MTGFEIINPGVFPGAKKSDFGKISVRRNERLADLFFRMDKVERAGTGIRRMKETMAMAGLHAPGIRQTGFYTIIFKRPIAERLAEKGIEAEKSWVKKLGEKGGESTEKSKEKSKEKGLADRLAEGLVDRLAESQKSILKLIKDNPYISKKELSETIRISTTAIDKNITRLKKERLLKRIGSPKGGHWEIVNG